MPHRFTMPANFLTLDSAGAAADGGPYDAHVRVVCARNLNKVFGQGRRLHSDAWPMDQPGLPECVLGRPGWWDILAVPVHKSWHLTACVASLYGVIPAGQHIDVALWTGARPFDRTAGAAAGASYAVTLAGTGALARYPAALANLTAPLAWGTDIEELWLGVKGEDLGHNFDKNGNHSGWYDELSTGPDRTYLRATPGSGIGGTGVVDFTNLVPEVGGAWLGLKAGAASTTWLLPPARILRVLSALEVYLEPGWNLDRANAGGVPPGIPHATAGGTPVWQLILSSFINMASWSAYEAEPASAALW